MPSIWRPAVGGANEVDLPVGDLRGALEALVAQFPSMGAYLLDAQGQVNPNLNVFLNSEHMRYHGGLSAPVGDGDEIYIVPIITGGCR